MQKKILAILAVAVVAIVAVASIGLMNQGSSTSEKTLTVGELWDITAVDPHAGDGTLMKEKALVGECLVGSNDDFSLKPELATSWKNIDNNTWEFNLRQHVMFHNGKEMKASDVKFSLERACNLNPTAKSLLKLDHVEIVSDYVVRIHTTAPNSIAPAALEYSSFVILSTDSVSGDKFVKPIGTGPFEMESYDNLTHQMTMVKNSDWWGGAVNFDKLIIKPITDPNTRALAIENHEVDFTADVPLSEINTIDALPGINVEKHVTPRVYRLAFNLDKDPWNNITVRHAIAYSINSKSIVDNALSGVGSPAKGIFLPDMAWANKSLTGYQYDANKAKALFAEAGFAYENGKLVNQTSHKQLSISILTYTDRPGLPLIAEALAGQLKDMGIDVTYDAKEYSAYTAQSKERQWDLDIMARALTMVPDPAYVFGDYLPGGSLNAMNYSNPEVVDLYNKMTAEWNITARYNYSQQIEGLLYNDAPAIYISYYGVAMVMYDYVTGFHFDPTAHDYRLNPDMKVQK
ncbi:MAG: ABC transporter substrate-binding protein [Methanomassiliicoccus sp.]|nr:ABC transporter substrate-binding protein [Methanomassiliicoccus sp.]